jgi:hypothetical protein
MVKSCLGLTSTFRALFVENVNRSRDAFLVGVCALALFTVFGCGGGSSQNNKPLDPGTITISAPASGATLTVLPATITLNLLNGATLSSAKVTLNGTDITSAFVSGANNTATATITSGVYVGSNRIQVTLPSQTVASPFSYDPSSASTPPPAPPGSGASTTLADTIPIQTRVQMKNGIGQQGWGIQVGQTAYPEPHGYTDGFQVLVLNRSSLALVSNTSYSLSGGANYTFNLEQFLGAITPSTAFTNACGSAGCLLIIQSLNTIGTGCPAGQACAYYGASFPNIGGTGTISFTTDPANLAYSFIGNVGSLALHAGSNFERITCASSSGCINTLTPNANQVLYGIAPNGVDGVLPNLKNTGSTGTTSIPATAYMPAMTISNNGAMAGEFVVDNTNNYTFAYADPQIHFYMGDEPNFTNHNLLTLDLPPRSQMTFPNGSHSESFASATLPANANGGFHLAVFDAVTLQNVANATYTVNPSSCNVLAGTNYCQSPDGTPVYNLLQLQSDIQTWNSPEYIIFLASTGNLDHDYYYGTNSFGPYDTQDVWDKVAQSVQDIGGTYATFVSLNNKSFLQDSYDQYLKNTWPHNDDYALVGQWWLNQSGVPNPYAMEESMQISRQTEANPVPSDVEGILEKQNAGYYQATLHSRYAGLMPAPAVALATVPLQPPTSWPLTGTGGTAGQIAAYEWISQQLLMCVNLTGCNDIRSAYTNLNLDPAIWLATLADLDAPADSGSGFSAADFATAKAQLAIEFQYLGYLREYQDNVLTLLQAEQTNASLILQQELDQLTGNIPFSGTSSYGYQDWRTDVEDSLNVVGAASGFIGLAATPASGGTSVAAVAGIQTAIGLTNMGLSLSAKTTNDPYGRSLAELEHLQIAGSQLAQTQVDQYAQILLSVGKDFDRIASDWGRLQAIGVPLANNAIPWDAGATGALLNSYDIATRRGFLRTLMPAGFMVHMYQYGSPGVNNTNKQYFPNAPSCKYYDFMNFQAEGNPTDPNTQQSYASYAYIPGAPIDGLAYSIPNTENVWPVDLWWDVWTMTDASVGSAWCTDTNQMPQNQLFLNTGIFAPLDPANPNQLGMYKVWFYQRTFGQSQLDLEADPAYNGKKTNPVASWWQDDQGLTLHMGSELAPDPVNY